MNEETKPRRKRTPVNEITRLADAAYSGEKAAERIWDRQPTILHLIRAVSVPSTGLAGTQGVAQFWLRPEQPGLAPVDRSVGYVRSYDAIGLEIQLEEKSVTGVTLPTVTVFVGWANVAGVTTR